MKLPGSGALAAALAAGLGLGALCPAAAATTAAPDDAIPIVFNDHHVYAKPDRLRAGRVLAAVLRHGAILVPLRSMFEQMGASVRFDRSTKTVDVSKPGADVRVTVGKPEVTLNGETRPLDVPPEIDGGVLLVPLRVLSEGMGAYVQWLPEKRIVVVRYLPAPVATPPPAMEATPAPTAVPSAPPPPPPAPSPSPASPAKASAEHFVVGDYLVAPAVYDALSPGNTGRSSFKLDAAAEFPLLKLPWMLEGDYQSLQYPHDANGTGVCPSGDQSCVSRSGGQGQAYVPSFEARADDFDGRFGLKVGDPHVYVGVGYIFYNTNNGGGQPDTQLHGVGGGIEKLPDLEHRFSLYGSAYYYPAASSNANQDLGNGTFGPIQYRILKYGIGGTFDLGKTPVFLDLGYQGDRLTAKQNAAADQSHAGGYAGLGIHF